MASWHDAYVAELERRWRERQPARNVDEVLAAGRVGRSEMRAWFREHLGRDMNLDDAEEVQPAVTRLMRKLRREFPQEVW
jgi:hypothetical protein